MSPTLKDKTPNAKTDGKSPESGGNTAKERSSLFVFVLISAFLWLASVASLVIPLSPQRGAGGISLVLEQTAPETIYADFDFSFLDEKTTEQRKAYAAQSAPNAYHLDEESIESTLKIVEDFLDELVKKKTLADSGEVYMARAAYKASEAAEAVNAKSVPILLLLKESDDRKNTFFNELSGTLSAGVFRSKSFVAPDAEAIIYDSQERSRKKKRASEIPDIREAAASVAEAVSKGFSPENRNLLKEELVNTLSVLIESNLIPDDEKSEELRENARKAVEPAIRTFKKGDPVIRKGQKIEAVSLDIFRTYLTEKEGFSDSRGFMKKIGYLSALSLAMLVVNLIYMRHVNPDISRSNKLLAITALVISFGILVNSGMLKLLEETGGLFNLSPLLAPSFLPLPMAALILSPIIGLRIALYASLYISMIAAIQLDSTLYILISGMLAGATSGFAVRHAANHRSYFLMALASSLAVIPAMNMLGLWSSGAAPSIIWISAGISAANCISFSIISLAMIFIFEFFFRVSTDMSLLVLCDYNHPLLKRLQLEAPGTYHHSLMVATLSDQAAREIGASPIRARACALFHDIGKLHMPAYFTENNMGAENKHDSLSPKLSVAVIQNHVKEGLKLAKKFKLPEIVRKSIEQHHGNDVVSFFYRRAVESRDAQSDQVLESDFKYPGLPPKEKEVVIVSLADVCEAASRAMASSPTPQKISELIGELFRKKMRDGQLERADLTFAELAKLRDSFVKTLSQMAHTRIAYPKEEEDDEGDLFKQTEKLSDSKNGPS